MQVCLRHIYLYPKFQNNNSFHTKRKLKIASSIIGVGEILIYVKSYPAHKRIDEDKIVFNDQDFPSPDATQIANNLSNLGQIYNREDISTDVKVSWHFKSQHVSTTLILNMRPFL